METDPVSETSCFLRVFSRIPDDGKSPETQKFYELFLYFIITVMVEDQGTQSITS
jgi:hypothetical protein